MLLHAVLAFALFETLVLAAVLLAWADWVAGARLLAAFLAGIALWIAGNELPNWFGPATAPVALRVLGLSPLISALFFHFCVVFCSARFGRLDRWVVPAAYALGGSATLAAQWLGAGYLGRRPHIGWIFLANDVGLAASMAWVVLGVAGVAVLLHSILRARRSLERLKFRQMVAVTASCLWGLSCLGGYGIAVLDLPVFPFPLLGFPLYPVILVYGILRYGVFVSNAWARRALAWALLLALGAVVVALTPLLPFESRWLGGLAVAASCFALSGPVRRVAERLVYPGGDVSVADLSAWRRSLQAVEQLPALEERASALLSERIGTPVGVCIGDASLAASVAELPRLVCRRGSQGWQTELLGWHAAPPGPRHAAELFGSVLAEAAAHVDQLQQLAARERERQLQARLAELGSLAATVAHDIRNPLNIISMAVAGAPAEARREVAEQVARISHLTRDLLDYAKPWKLNLARIDLSAQVRAVALRWPSVSFGAGLDGALPVEVDARRMDQVLTNLFENSRIAASDGRPVQVHVEAEIDDASVQLHVCDDGPGVPDAIRERLFEPFASRSPGGTGLGLAIVARIMDAHGGSVALTERPPWRTCFTLRLPCAAATP